MKGSQICRTTFAAGFESAIEIDCAENGLEGICEYRIPLKTTGLQLPFTKLDVITQFQTGSQLRECITTHHARPQAGQVTFAAA